jgi:GrpB-like predicted nucleotidyltransferase (UPF0157 family)
MRLPPLPVPSAPLTPEQMAQRVVGDRPAEVRKPITISPYDPGWPTRYLREEARIRVALGTRALAVEHVGSTAVPGLAAKDRIDIDLIVADPADEETYLPDLAAAGYTLATREPRRRGTPYVDGALRRRQGVGHRGDPHACGPTLRLSNLMPAGEDQRVNGLDQPAWTTEPTRLDRQQQLDPLPRLIRAKGPAIDRCQEENRGGVRDVQQRPLREARPLLAAAAVRTADRLAD